jgi:hypothetical protein
LKWGLILGGAWYLLKDQIGAAFGAPATATAAAQPSAPATALPVTTLDTKGLMRQQSGGLQVGTYDQWNYYYSHIRGVDAPARALVFPGVDAAFKFTLDEWWAGVAAKGLSGLGRRTPAQKAWGY